MCGVHRDFPVRIRADGDRAHVVFSINWFILVVFVRGVEGKRFHWVLVRMEGGRVQVVFSITSIFLMIPVHGVEG